MVLKCCVIGCKSEQYPGCEMKFYGFPLDNKWKRKWIEDTCVTGNIKHKRICLLHFSIEDFVVKGTITCLKQNAMPTFLTPPFNINFHNGTTFHATEQYDIPNEQDYKTHEEYDNTDDLILNISDDDNIQHSNNDLGIQSLHENIKMAGIIARCKCCLENNNLQRMWQEHCRGGVQEVYGTMLIECFALPWRKPKDSVNSKDLICQSCIRRLKDAVSFKTEVMASQQLLSGQLEGGEVNVYKLKQEQDDEDINIETDYLHYKDLEDNATDKDIDNSQNDCLNDNNYMLVCDVDNKFNKNRKEKYIAGFNEVTIKIESHPTIDVNQNARNIEETSERRHTRMGLRKRKQPLIVGRAVDSASKTLMLNAASKRYKVIKKGSSGALLVESGFKPPDRDNEISDIENLTTNLRNSVKAAYIRKKTNIKAAIAYDVPHEHIVKDVSKISKVSLDNNEDNKEANNIKVDIIFDELSQVPNKEQKVVANKDFCKMKAECAKPKISKIKQRLSEKSANNKKPSENRLAEMKKQTNNIAVILEFTNATPIRRHGGIGYGCCFCNEEFPNAADLKNHTMTEHDVKSKRNYAKGKRPSAYLVKLDITGLKCNLCDNTIDSLNQLYDHLIEVHKKLLYRNAKNYIIPFKFDQDELRCLFCEFICNSFKGLLEHMSVHYRNHICEICDAGFLTKNNLFNHAGRHKKGTFKCDYCTKVFDTSSKKAGHQRLVHSSTNGVNRCGYCGEMFGTYRRKEKHLITEHGVILKKLKCKACDKIFETQTALRIHTKRDHLIERRFKCSVCDKRCFTNVQLMQHMLKHTGIKKFQCTICLKAYGRKSTLREHMRIHENDRRFKCELCGMAFVQKCSWRGHMLSKHGQHL